MSKKNVIWVDCAKIFACICVVLGHLYMSMVESGWISETATYYCLPTQTIYCFHNQIFFVCSGFLYQKFRKDVSVKGHFKNSFNKLIALGVPYFVFTTITILLKNVFSGSVNSKATPFLETIFIKPTAPYWFLYILFLLFLIIPAVNSKRKLYIIFILSLIIKVIVVLMSFKLPYVINLAANCSIWFTTGMIITTIKFRFNIVEKLLCIFAGIVGLGLSIFFFHSKNENKIIIFIISVLLVSAIIYLFNWLTKDGSGTRVSKLRKYILPVFLMHTIFAAGFRSILIKVGINSLGIHIFVGIIASFAIPMLIYKFIENKWCLLIFIEPLKAWKMKKSKEKS